MIKPYVRGSFISEFVQFLGADPRLKFTRIISTPELPEEYLAFTKNSWSSLMNRGYHMLINNSNEAKINWNDKLILKIHAVMSIYRGKNLDEVESGETGFKNFNNMSRENYDTNQICKLEKHLTIVNNSNFLTNDLTNTLNKAENMFDHNAFIHQYEKYGMEKLDFLEAFSFCQQVNFDYNNII